MPTSANGTNGTPLLLGPDGSPVRADPRSTYSGEFALPHVLTFSTIWNTANKVYSWRWDEAMRSSRSDAVSMRRDAFLMGLMQERKLATAQLNWHLEPEDAKDARQMAGADAITKIVKSTPMFSRFIYAMLEAIWYGRYGINCAYGWTERRGKRTLSVLDWRPVNGDKIQYGYKANQSDTRYHDDGTPVVLINATYANKIPSEDVVYTEQGKGLLLKRPYWRERFLIHKHEPDDADFFDGEMAGGVHGVGVRSRIYWLNWIRQEFLANVMDFVQRVGQGFLIFYYEAGNPASEAKAIEAANKASSNTVIVWPRPIGSEKQGAGVDKIDMPMSGSDMLIKLQDHFQGIIERYIVGQSMSSGADNESGLGGSGRAAFAADTKYRIVKFDAANAEDTLTHDFVRVLHRWNLPGEDYLLRWTFDVDKPNAKDVLDAASKCYSMNVKLKADEVREFAGLSKPGPDDEVLQQPQQGGGGPGGMPPGMGGPPGAPDGPGGDPNAPQGMDGGDDGSGDLAPPDAPQAPTAPVGHAGKAAAMWQPFQGPRGGKWQKNPLTGALRHMAREGEPWRYWRGEDEVERYEKTTGKGRWITIGSKTGEGGKKTGGSPVYVENGKITKGHPSLTGKHVHALKDDAEPTSHRKEMHQAKGHARAVWAKKAKADGIPTDHLHSLAAEILSHDRAFKENRTHLLQAARKLSADLGHGDIRNLKTRAARGIDSDNVRGLDDVAARMAEDYPEEFGGHEDDVTGRLFDLLSEGNPEPMSEEDAYQQAYDHLAGEAAAVRDEHAQHAVGADEVVPFERQEGPARYVKDTVGHEHKGSDHVSRQYRYTQEFHDRNADAKFERVSQLEPHIDKIQQSLARTMTDKAASLRTRDAAAIASVIAETGLRPTDGADSVKHGHYGISSLLGQHAKVVGDEIHLDFIGKEGVRNQTVVRDPANVAYLKAALAQGKPGEPLFPHATSDHAGAVLKEAAVAAGAPADTKLKDLRTVKATQKAREVVEQFEGPPPPLTGQKDQDAKTIAKAILAMSGEVAKVLNSTATIARDTSIHPAIWRDWQQKLAGGAARSTAQQFSRLSASIATPEARQASLDQSLSLLAEQYGLTAEELEVVRARVHAQ